MFEKLKKKTNRKVKLIPVLNSRLGTIPEETRKLRNQMASTDHPNYNVIKIDQNAEKSPVDLWRLVVIQTPVEDKYKTLVGWKNSLQSNNDNNVLETWTDLSSLKLLLKITSLRWCETPTIIIIIIIIIIILGQKIRPHDNQAKKKKRTYKIVDFAVPADHRIKLKEREKKYKYRDFARELKKQTNYGTWRW